MIETRTVPDSVATELYRKQIAMLKTAIGSNRT